MREKILESLYRMKQQAKKNVEDNVKYYVMHAACAVEFADMAINYLEGENTETCENDGFDLITLHSDKIHETVKSKVWAFIAINVNGEERSKRVVKVDGNGADAVLLYARIMQTIEKFDREVPEIKAHYMLAKLAGCINAPEEEENLYADSSDGNKE